MSGIFGLRCTVYGAFMRWLAVVAAVGVLAGCGSTTGGPGAAPIEPDTAAPPIVALDEAPPDDIAWFLKDEFGETPAPATSTGVDQVRLCATPQGSDGMTPCPPPSPDEQAKLQAGFQKLEELVRPAAGTEPRVVAKLSLGAGDDLLFTVWTAAGGKLCWQVDEESDNGGGGGGGPSGPCEQDAEATAFPGDKAILSGDPMPPCTSFCLESQTYGDDPASNRYYLSGTVPADADALRVTSEGGAVATYPLVGPRISNTDARVFLLDLGLHDWRKTELVDNGAVTDTIAMPAIQVASEECSAEIGPPPMPTPGDDQQAILDALKPYNAKFEACIRARPH